MTKRFRILSQYFSSLCIIPVSLDTNHTQFRDTEALYFAVSTGKPHCCTLNVERLKLIVEHVQNFVVNLECLVAKVQRLALNCFVDTEAFNNLQISIRAICDSVFDHLICIR
jgi:hypothetical protein